MRIVDSTVLGCRVLLAAEGEPIPSSFAALPTYTWDEVDLLHAAGASADDLRAVHAAKTALGGTVVPGRAVAAPRRLPRPPARPAPAPAPCEACGGRLDPVGRCGWCS